LLHHYCRIKRNGVGKKLHITFLEKLENIPLTNYIRLCLI